MLKSIIMTCGTDSASNLNIIQWCNNNQGFISAILSLLTIFVSVIAIIFSIRVGVIPYKKKLTVQPFYYKDGMESKMEILLINNGLSTLAIRNIIIKDNKKTNVSGASIQEPLILKPYEFSKVIIHIYDINGLIEKYALDLNKKMTIEVYDYDGDVLKYNKGFPVG